MSEEFAVVLFLICAGSCYACFRLGQENAIYKQDKSSSQDETTKK